MLASRWWHGAYFFKLLFVVFWEMYLLFGDHIVILHLLLKTANMNWNNKVDMAVNTDGKMLALTSVSIQVCIFLARLLFFSNWLHVLLLQNAEAAATAKKRDTGSANLDSNEVQPATKVPRLDQQPDSPESRFWATLLARGARYFRSAAYLCSCINCRYLGWQLFFNVIVPVRLVML